MRYYGRSTAWFHLGPSGGEAALANVEEARLLELHPPAAVLRMERVTRNVQDVVLEYVESVYRGDRYKFYAHLRA